MSLSQCSISTCRAVEMKLSVEKSVLELLPEGNLWKAWLLCQSAWLVDLNSRPEENVFERILNKLLQTVFGALLWCWLRYTGVSG